MLRPVLASLVTAATLLGTTAAQAGTSWSIGINLPPADVYVSSAPRYHVRPAPIYYTPAPRYVQREYYYYAPPPRVVYERHHHVHRWHGHRGHDRHHRHDRHRHWDDDHGPHRGR